MKPRPHTYIEPAPALFAPHVREVRLAPHFDGATYEPARDGERLGTQLARVLAVMQDGKPHTLDELVTRCGGTTASVSARIRDLRKPQFGGCLIRRTPPVEGGVHLYTLTGER